MHERSNISPQDSQQPPPAPMPSISVFFPCHNEVANIEPLVKKTIQVLTRLTPDFEIIIVDDGSTDGTNKIIDTLAADHDSVKAVHHKKNLGYGAALQSGFRAATKELVFYTDGDAQYDVRELELLLERAGPDVDVVQGYKITRSDPLHRKIIGRIYHYVVKTAFGLKLRDVDCDFRLIRRSVFDTVHLESDSGVICAEMMMKIQRGGFHVVEVPVHHFQRAHGKSQFFNFSRIARVVWQLGGLWVRYVLLHALLPGNRHHDPLRGPEKTVSGPRVRDAGGH